MCNGHSYKMRRVWYNCGMLDIYDLGYAIYESNSYPVGVLDLKDSAAMELEPPYVGSYIRGCPRNTRNCGLS